MDSGWFLAENHQFSPRLSGFTGKTKKSWENWNLKKSLYKKLLRDSEDFIIFASLYKKTLRGLSDP